MAQSSADVAAWLADQGITAKVQAKSLAEGVNGPCMQLICSDHDHTALAELGIASQVQRARVIGNWLADHPLSPLTRSLPPAAESDPPTFDAEEQQLEAPLLLAQAGGSEAERHVTIQDEGEGREVFYTANIAPESPKAAADVGSGISEVHGLQEEMYGPEGSRCGLSTTQLFALFAVAIAIIDLPVDVAFLVDIAGKHKLLDDFAAACGTLAVAVLANLFILLHFVHKESAANPDFRRWLQANQTWVMPVFFLSLFKFDCMRLLYTKLFPVGVFAAPLSVASQQRLVWHGIVGTVVEGLPQLIITAHVHQVQGHLNNVMLAMLVVNSCSLLYTVLMRLVVGVVYSRGDSHPKHNNCCSRMFSAAPDMLLSLLLIGGVAVVFALLLHHHQNPYTCFGAVTDLVPTECKAFGALHNATRGENWRDCRELQSPCSCDLVTCVGGHITALHMSSNNLEGTLPTGVFSQMAQLTSLQLDDNWQQWNNHPPSPGPTPPITRGLHGQVPSDIMLLTNLVELNLSSTELKGDLKLFSDMTQLTSLDLSTLGWTDMAIWSDLPSSRCGCECSSANVYPSKITSHFVGSIDSLKPLTQLRTLRLHGSRWYDAEIHENCDTTRMNSISGSTSVFAQILRLTSLTLSSAGYSSTNSQGYPYNASIAVGNRVTGGLPLWMLRDSGRLTVDLGGNGITLPHNIGDLHTSSPSVLDVGGWGLNGTLPSSLSALTTLRRLNLSQSNFSGSIDPLSTLVQLTSLDVSSTNEEGWSGCVNDYCNNLTGELAVWMLRKKVTGEMELRLKKYDDNLFGLPHDIGSLEGTITMLEMSGQGLGGTLPASFSNLMSLQRLNLAGNSLIGGVDPLSTLVQLRRLDLSDNDLRGELPLWMLRMNLTGEMELDLAGNDNRIGLPHDIGSLEGTIIKDELDLSDQGLGGPLPASLGNLTSLRRLNLARNRFSGDIGPLSTLVQLTNLELSDGNGFNGELQLWMLRKNLTGEMELDVTGSYNRIGLPNDIGSLEGTAIKDELDLSDQGLGGPLPASLGNLTSLRRLNLAGNRFSGELPLSLLRKNLTGEMELLDLTGNRIGLPHDIGSLEGTVIKDELDMSDQGLGGPLPASLGALTSLRRLNLSSNRFSGSIGLLSTLTGLEELGLGCLSYRWPMSLGYALEGCGDVNGTLSMLSRLTNLRSLDLSGQQVKGPLEPLSGLTKLTSLVLAYSHNISGTIPTSFAQLSQLTTLQLQCCSLTGRVPALAVFEHMLDYAQQCEIDEADKRGRCTGPFFAPTEFDPQSNPNRFSCPLPAGAKDHCSGACA
jgi:hypothetical protein